MVAKDWYRVTPSERAWLSSLANAEPHGTLRRCFVIVCSDIHFGDSGAFVADVPCDASLRGVALRLGLLGHADECDALRDGHHPLRHRPAGHRL